MINNKKISDYAINNFDFKIKEEIIINYNPSGYAKYIIQNTSAIEYDKQYNNYLVYPYESIIKFKTLFSYCCNNKFNILKHVLKRYDYFI